MSVRATQITPRARARPSPVTSGNPSVVLATLLKIALTIHARFIRTVVVAEDPVAVSVLSLTAHRWTLDSVFIVVISAYTLAAIAEVSNRLTYRWSRCSQPNAIQCAAVTSKKRPFSMLVVRHERLSRMSLFLVKRGTRFDVVLRGNGLPSTRWTARVRGTSCDFRPCAIAAPCQNCGPYRYQPVTSTSTRCHIAETYQWHCRNLILLMVTLAYI
jgi:hypothetical protein